MSNFHITGNNMTEVALAHDEPQGPQVNEVWQTNAGRLALIVDAHPEGQQQRSMMLWMDPLHKHWTVSEIMGRLRRKTSMTPREFFACNLR
jgi:hypothetical protein